LKKRRVFWDSQGKEGNEEKRGRAREDPKKFKLSQRWEVAKKNTKGEVWNNRGSHVGLKKRALRH